MFSHFVTISNPWSLLPLPTYKTSRELDYYDNLLMQHGLNIRNDVNSKLKNHIEIGLMCHLLHTNKIGNYINVLKLQNKPKLMTLEN
jgi:hypothetical protein